MGINKNLFEIINNINLNDNYLDFEYIESHKLKFVINNKNISIKKNNLFNFNHINNGWLNYNEQKKQYEKQLNKNNIIKELIFQTKNKIINEKDNENLLTLNKFINKYNLNEINKGNYNKQHKVIKNKKIVYTHKLLINKKKKVNNKKKNAKRNSKYRGVSKNGIGWQVLKMYNRNKPYIGTYYSEDLAAKIYDIASIKMNGINAKTNFLYNKIQIDKILKTNFNFKDPNISQFISELIY